MNDRLNINPALVKNRWVSYFDLLGFSALLKSSITHAFYQWELCLTELQYWSNRWPDLEYAYFSDTFLIYAPDDSTKSFIEIEAASRWFFQLVLQRNIPLRGAVACDEFYADKSKAIFLGKALVETAKTEQKYNWIGFVLCDSAIRRMSEIGLPADQRLNYRKWSLPTKNENAYDKLEEAIALLYGASYPINSQNTLIRELERMAERETDLKVREILPDSKVIAIAFADDYRFGILQSRFHIIWTTATQALHGGERPTYNPTECFETFPFPFADDLQLPKAMAQNEPAPDSGWENVMEKRFYTVKEEPPAFQGSGSSRREEALTKKSEIENRKSEIEN